MTTAPNVASLQVDTQETKGTVPSLGVEKPIERVTVLLT
jgi:hypothetical protein